MANVVVTVQDAYDNTVTSAGTVITLTPSAGTLYGAVSVTASSGIATFSAVSMTLVGSGYTFTTSNNGALTNDTSAAFNITPGAIDNYLVEVTVNPIGAGVTGTGTATARDAYGNTVTGAATTLTMTKNNVSGIPTVTFYTAGDDTGTVNNVYSTWSSGVLTFWYTATFATDTFTVTATDDQGSPKTGTSVTIVIN